MKNYLSKLLMALRLANYRRLRKRREPQRIAYRQWVMDHDTITHEKRIELERTAASLPRQPLISVIMPVYNAPIAWLDLAIESVRQQIYKNWELCIADDCSTNTDIRSYLEEKSSKDHRIKVEFRTVNGHISAASNSAIALASGEFLALMDQDDLIPPNALLEVATCINHHPHAGLIYSDEDKVDDQNQREAPTRKGGWRRELLLKYNSISHLGAYKTKLVREIGGFRLGYEGSQDHDLALRCIERLADDQIVHIGKILYHWRIHENSTSHMQSAKPYAVIARNKSIQDHITRITQRKT